MTPIDITPSTGKSSPVAAESSAPSQVWSASPGSRLAGRRVAMVMFSTYPSDPRPRRAASALTKEGAVVDLICLAEDKSPKHERQDGLNVRRIAIRHRRGGKLDYAYQYCAFIFVSSLIVAWRCLKQRYDLVYVHNMPDVLVVSGLFPKMFGAKVILDQHDPMPELMTTIFGLPEASFSVQLIKWFEKWSLRRANLVITVNIACQKIFAARSCPADKIGVVMNAPDDNIFPFRAPRSYASNNAEDKFVIMYHGSLVERNGVDLAVQAMPKVLESVPNAELRIYGKRTPFLDQVLEQAKALGLHDAVRYLGPRRLEELVGDIEDCRVGVIPNQRNPFTDINTPTRIFEYLALGKPVVAPSTPGILDYFGADSLFFFESGKADDLAREVIRVQADPNRAKEVAGRGQEIYLQHTWKQERQTLVTLVGSLLPEGEA